MRRLTPLAIRTVGLSKRYAGSVPALDGIDLAVRVGEVFGLLGPNGAGKSTAIQILTTLLFPTQGAAYVMDRDVVREPEAVRRLIGVALQDTGVDPLLTGVEALSLQACLYGASHREASQRAEELVEQLQLQAVARRRIGVYSGGMRRRLDLALAMVHRPKVLFLDEPTTGLDPLSREALWEVVRVTRATAGTTVFLTTQYLEEADALCDRIALLRAGRIVAEGTPARLKRELQRDVIEVVPSDPTRLEALLAVVARFAAGPQCDREAVRVVVPHGAEVTRAILEAVQVAGISLASLRVAPPTLDDVFRAFTGAGSSDPGALSTQISGGLGGSVS
jgi:ABC-2 type transport system ATP-binding protein